MMIALYIVGGILSYLSLGGVVAYSLYVVFATRDSDSFFAVDEDNIPKDDMSLIMTTIIWPLAIICALAYGIFRAIDVFLIRFSRARIKSKLDKKMGQHLKASDKESCKEPHVCDVCHEKHIKKGEYR